MEQRRAVVCTLTTAEIVAIDRAAALAMVSREQMLVRYILHGLTGCTAVAPPELRSLVWVQQHIVDLEQAVRALERRLRSVESHALEEIVLNTVQA